MHLSRFPPRFSATMINFYGMSETTKIICGTPHQPWRVLVPRTSRRLSTVRERIPFSLSASVSDNDNYPRKAPTNPEHCAQRKAPTYPEHCAQRQAPTHPERCTPQSLWTKIIACNFVGDDENMYYMCKSPQCLCAKDCHWWWWSFFAHCDALDMGYRQAYRGDLEREGKEHSMW